MTQLPAPILRLEIHFVQLSPIKVITQTDMTANAVIANRAIPLAAGTLG
jgi:hypothetical protein